MDSLLSEFAVEDIWGIGKQSMLRLHQHGVASARALKDVDHLWARRHLTVVGERIIFELRGLECLPLQPIAKPKQSILSSLSFGRPVEALDELLEAISCHATWAAEKLRTQQSVARYLSIFLHTNYFHPTDPQYANSVGQHLLFPTSFTPTLIQAARTLLPGIYKPGYRYKKVGVYLTEISSREVIQPDLFREYSLLNEQKQQRLMATIDSINRKLGHDTLFLGAQGLKRFWQMKQQRRSPHYTTRWQEILTIS